MKITKENLYTEKAWKSLKKLMKFKEYYKAEEMHYEEDLEYDDDGYILCISYIYNFEKTDILNFNLNKICEKADCENIDEEHINIFNKFNDDRELLTDAFLFAYYDKPLRELFKFNDRKTKYILEKLKTKIVINNFNLKIKIEDEVREFMKETLEQDLNKKDEKKKVVKI